MSSYKRWKADPEAQAKRDAEAMEKKKAAEKYLKENSTDASDSFNLANGVLGGSSSNTNGTTSASSGSVDNTLLLYRREQLKEQAKAQALAEAEKTPPPEVITSLETTSASPSPPLSPKTTQDEQLNTETETNQRDLPIDWVLIVNEEEEEDEVDQSDRDVKESENELPELFRHLRTGCVTSRPPRRTTRGVLSSSAIPDAIKGILDEESGRMYFWDSRTGTVSWDMPEHKPKKEKKKQTKIEAKAVRKSRWDVAPAAPAVLDSNIANSEFSSGSNVVGQVNVSTNDVSDTNMQISDSSKGVSTGRAASDEFPLKSNLISDSLGSTTAAPRTYTDVDERRNISAVTVKSEAKPPSCPDVDVNSASPTIPGCGNIKTMMKICEQK